MKKIREFFKGVSWAQALAGGLAAVTAFLLSARIGLAGSVIGVAIGAIVSTVASQLYTNMLNKSAKKLKETIVGEQGEEEDGGQGGTSGTLGNASATAAAPGELASTHAAEPESATNRRRAPRIVAGSAHADGASEHLAPTRILASDKSDHESARGTGPRAPLTGGQHVGARATTPASVRRRAIIVAVVSGLLAVLLTAGIISLVTRGEGTDSVVRDMVNSSRVEREPDHTTPSPSTSTSAPQPTQGSPSSESIQNNTQGGSDQNSASPTTGGSGTSTQQTQSPTTSAPTTGNGSTTTPSPSTSTPTTTATTPSTSSPTTSAPTTRSGE